MKEKGLCWLRALSCAKQKRGHDFSVGTRQCGTSNQPMHPPETYVGQHKNAVLQLHQKAGKNQHPGSRRDWSEQVGQARTAGPVLGGREGKDHFVGTESKETWLLCFAFLRQAALMPPSWTAKALKTVSAGRFDA